MELSTYVQAQSLQVTLTYLKQIKLEMETPATQEVIRLTKRKLPATPPAALTDSLDAVETVLLAQAVIEIDNQIAALQTAFDDLQDES